MYEDGGLWGHAVPGKKNFPEELKHKRGVGIYQQVLIREHSLGKGTEARESMGYLRS